MRTDLVIKYLEELELPYDDYCVNSIVKNWEKEHEEEIKENNLYEIDDEDVKSYWFYYVKENLFN